MLKSNLRSTVSSGYNFCTMSDARSSRVLHERKHDGARGVGAEKGDTVGEAITVYIRFGGDERNAVDIWHPCWQGERQERDTTDRWQQNANWKRGGRQLEGRWPMRPSRCRDRLT